MMTRRGFIGSAAAAVSLGAFRTCAAGAGCVGRPNLVLGVVSDIHAPSSANMDAFRKALVWYRERGADGVVLTGDLTTWSEESEFMAVSKVWNSIFPDDRLPDGRKVEKLFVTGNHDVDGWDSPKGRANFRRPVEESGFPYHREEFWKRYFGEPYAAVVRKEVKGYTFVLRNWHSRHSRFREGNPLPDWFAAHGKELPTDRPFFLLQHEPPLGGCNSPWANPSVCDRGEAAKCLSMFPNAVALTGHTHYSLGDDSSVWQGAYTSVNCGSACAWPFTAAGRENGHAGDENEVEMQMIPKDSARQAMILSVYADRLVFERRDLIDGEPLGDDWIIPIGHGAARPYAHGIRRTATPAPRFGPGAKVTVVAKEGEDRAGDRHEQIVVTFPAVNGLLGGARAYDFEVSAEGLCADGRWVSCGSKAVFSPNAFRSPKADVRPVTCVFAKRGFSGKVAARFSVRPRDVWGKAGSSIVSARFGIES